MPHALPAQPAPLPAWRLLGQLAAIAALVAACGAEPAPQPPPPLAGLQHAEVVRVGEVVTFDAEPSRAGVLRNSDGGVVEEVSIVRYRFIAADGSPEAEVATPKWQHTFTDTGIFAVQLEVEDARGRTSRVSSSIHVAADYTSTCTEQEPGDCPSGRCFAGVCSHIACAGQAVCPGGTTCATSACLVDPPDTPEGDVFTGADAGAVGIDADDRRIP